MYHFLGLLVLSFFPFASVADTYTVVGVKDADTIEVVSDDKKRLVIRMNSVDGVEKNQPMGRAAKKYLSGLIFRKAVEIEPFKLDKYGRTVATVWLGNTDVNLEVIKAGYAWVYREYADPKIYPEYYAAEAEAKNKRIGLWSLPNPISPWEWRHPPLKPLSLSGVDTEKCGKKRFCKQMVSCEEAKYYFNVCGIHALDKDGDGQPCNRLCR
jgi:endonuclease YncB( thermonuclease family)